MLLECHLTSNIIDYGNTLISVPFLLYMKCANVVMFSLVSKQDVLEPLPHLFTRTLTPNGDIHIFDLVDANQTCPQVVQSKTCFDQIRLLIKVLRRQWYSELSKAPLELTHTPFCSLAIREDRPQELECAFSLLVELLLPEGSSEGERR